MFAALFLETEIGDTDVSCRLYPLPDLLGAPGLRGARGEPHLCRGRRQHPGRVQAALPGRRKLQPDFAFWTRQLAST